MAAPGGSRRPRVALFAQDAFLAAHGIARYQTEMAARLYPAVDLHLLMLGKNLRRVAAPWPEALARAPRHLYSSKRFMASHPLALGARLLANRDLVRPPMRAAADLISTRVVGGLYCDRAGFDLIHGTSNYLPRTRGPAPRLCTVHDLTAVHFPEGLPPQITRGLLKPGDLREADHLVVDSEASRAEAQAYFALPPERVHVAPLGVDLEVFTPRTQAPQDFLLTVSIIAQHKNHARALEAFEQFWKAHRQARWKVVGPKGWGWAAFESKLASSPARSHVDVLGQVPEPQLLELYRHARCFLMPSLSEGFGLPVAEAMATGVPVAASRIPALNELGGDALAYFDPLSTVQMVEAMEQAYSFDAATAARVERGLARVRKYTWAATARRTLEAYEKVLGQPLPLGAAG